MMGKKFSVHEFHFTYFNFPIDVKQLASVEWELEDFEHAINKILRKTKESDLDKLIKNYIQSKCMLQIIETMEAVAFVRN